MDTHPKDTQGIKTGWPPGLLQGDNRLLGRWFADRIDARYVLRKMLDELQTHETPSGVSETRCKK